MSVIAMGQSASNPTRRTPPAGESDSERALRVIATYIPTEALAAYLALIGILVPAAGTPTGQIFAVKLIALGASLALAVGLVFLGFTPGANDDPLTARRKRAQLIGFAVVALLAYSLATPGGPWDGNVLGIGGDRVGCGYRALPRAAPTGDCRPLGTPSVTEDQGWGPSL